MQIPRQGHLALQASLEIAPELFDCGPALGRALVQHLQDIIKMEKLQYRCDVCR